MAQCMQMQVDGGDLGSYAPPGHHDRSIQHACMSSRRGRRRGVALRGAAPPCSMSPTVLPMRAPLALSGQPLMLLLVAPLPLTAVVSAQLPARPLPITATEPAASTNPSRSVLRLDGQWRLTNAGVGPMPSRTYTVLHNHSLVDASRGSWSQYPAPRLAQQTALQVTLPAVATAEGCCDACAKTAGCGAAVWDGHKCEARAELRARRTCCSKEHRVLRIRTT